MFSVETDLHKFNMFFLILLTPEELALLVLELQYKFFKLDHVYKHLFCKTSFKDLMKFEKGLEEVITA